jgi:hypothetical protein
VFLRKKAIALSVLYVLLRTKLTAMDRLRIARRIAELRAEIKQRHHLGGTSAKKQRLELEELLKEEGPVQ